MKPWHELREFKAGLARVDSITKDLLKLVREEVEAGWFRVLVNYKPRTVKALRQVQRRPCRGRTSYSCSNSTDYFRDLRTLDERIVSGHLCAGRAFLFGRIDDPVPPSGMGLRLMA